MLLLALYIRLAIPYLGARGQVLGSFNLSQPQSSGCRVIPLDSKWPTLHEWAALNQSVGGRLIATVPAGSPCYKSTFDVSTGAYDLSTYDEAACATVQKSWHEPLFHEQSSSSVMQTYFAGDSCNPIADQSNGKCGIGNYNQYAIDVAGDDDVRVGLAFAQEHNVRILIKNTGHDYLGRSTGHGALALWTHHLKEISPVITNYQSNEYTGPALKVQAGIQVGEVYDFLEKQGYMAIGGECPTVGLAGGYIFAGGHAPTTSKLGLAADKILEIEGILANGSSFTATPDKYQDIYWFLSGSGSSGTIAYAKSVTFKIFKDFPISGAILTLPYAGIVTDDEFWSLVDTWHTLTPSITDAGGYAYAFYQTGYFQIWPLFVPDVTKKQTAALIQPFVNQLDELKGKYPKLAYNLTSYTYPTFNQAYKALFPPFQSGTYQWTSRLIPRNIITQQTDAVSQTFRTLFDDGATMVEAVMNPNLKVAQPLNNSVLPAWRTNIIDLVAGKPYNDSASFEDNTDAKKYITQHWTSALEQLAPASQGGGAYMNEADPDDPNWQQSIYGENYPRQLAIKRKYDPTGVWYAKTAVGSEYWAEDAEGRLCPADPAVS
ncbi:uncharacterized protein KY384_007161 [Bacidia gigantensis]|uniref:uncharacterized protein n=1 Tax=Bacidia gigantensis TaxID=2732470 RepID=UPI001D04DE36|nr:uncharacterized protein KY384_007161 [Bacidia gigantensis]KAG8528244.1 hypothetical protein KY384_007161 [Bacidia gigantensis]